jgi:hypothetical protein
MGEFLKSVKSELAYIREQMRHVVKYFSETCALLPDKNDKVDFEKKIDVCSAFSAAIGAVKVNAEKCEEFDLTKKQQGFHVKCFPKVVMCIYYDVFYERFYIKNASKTTFGSKKNVRLVCSSVVNVKEYHDMISHRNIHVEGEGLRTITTMDGETYRQSTNTGLRGIKNDLNQNVIKYVQDTINDPRMVFVDNNNSGSGGEVTLTMTSITAFDKKNTKEYRTADERALFGSVSKLNVALFGIVYRTDSNSFSREEAELFEKNATVWDIPLKYQCHRLFVNLNSMLHDMSPICVK